MSSWGLTPGSRLWELSQRDPYRIHWIAAVALLPRDDKKCITLTLSCHCERSEAIQSVVLSRSDTYFLFNSAFAGANKFDYLDPVVKMHPTKTFVFAGAPRTRMTKRIQSTKNPHMIIFALQDMWQTNKINIKHVPNLNGGLLPAWGDGCFVKYYQLSLQYLCFYQTRTAQKW